MPGFRRDKNPFNLNVIETAEHQHIGLMTTWDLYRIVRSFLRNGWSSEQIKPIFYRAGRIEPHPGNYTYLGCVEDTAPKISVVGIRLENQALCRGDRIAFELPIEFVEQEVTSLQFNREDVEQVDTGNQAGVKTILDRQETRRGIRVFKLN